MKQLNFKDLKVGQKVWSIQLGDCEVFDFDRNSSFPLVLKSNTGEILAYTEGGGNVLLKTSPLPFLN